MDVIGVGMGRTGTLSLKLALEELGYGPCYHMKEVMDRGDRIKAWRRVGEGAPADWDELYRGYRATVDWPGAFYWRELVDAYPKAKVILGVRDPERWADSMSQTLWRWPLRRRNLFSRWMYTLFSAVNPSSLAVPRMLDHVWDQIFDRRNFDKPGDREVAIKSFVRHNEEVKAYVEPGRLLVYQISQGWEPLCEFLGVPVPQTPMPRVNESAEFRRDMVARTVKSVVQVTSVVVTLVAVALGVAAMTHNL
jgi:hypothetical protein